MSLSSGVFDGEHGAVLDSGTTYAYLPDAAFAAFEEAVTLSNSLLTLTSAVMLGFFFTLSLVVL